MWHTKLMQANILNLTFFALNASYHKISLLFSESKESVYIKASRNEEYQQFEEWRSSLIRYVVLIEKHILKDIRPQLLHKMIVLEQERMFKHMKSPFFYYEYFKILEQNLPPDTPVVFSYILRDARERLRQKLIKQPQLALDYFYKDILFQLIRLSGKKTSVQRFKQMMHFYKQSVPEGIYTSVRDDIKDFLKNYTNDDPAQIDTNELPYIQLQQKIDSIFEEYNAPVIRRAEKKLKTQAKEHPQLIALAILSLLAGGWYALSAKENKHDGLKSFNLNNINLDPFLANSILHYFSGQFVQNHHSYFVLYTPLSILMNLSPLIYKTQADSLKSSAEPVTFFNVYNWTNGDTGYTTSMQPTFDGGYIVLGNTNVSTVAFLFKLSKEGDFEWRKTIENRLFSGAIVREIGDGTYITVGSLDMGKKSLAISNWDSEGIIMWASYLNWPYESKGASITPDKDGGFLVTGFVDDEKGNRNSFLAKWDANKILIWSKIFNMQAYNYPYYIKQLDNGDCVLIGDIRLEDKSDTDIFILRLDVSGNVTFAQTFGTLENDHAVFVMVSNEDYIVSGWIGESYNLMEIKGFYTKININGTLAWSQILNQSQTLGTIQKSSAGNYISVGSFFDNSTNITSIKPMLLQLTPNGTIFEAKSIDLATNHSVFRIIYPTLDGGSIITGNNYGNGWFDTMLLKLDSQLELINCPILLPTSLPLVTSAALQLNTINITVESLSLSLINISIATLDAALKLIEMCPDDEEADEALVWPYITALAAIVLTIVAIVIYCYLKKYKQNQSSKEMIDIKQDKFEYTIEFAFEGNIKIREKLGAGSYGEVYKASVIYPAYPVVAVKKFHLEVKDQQATKDSFMQEIKVMRALAHPNIIPLYGFSIDVPKQDYYIVMEYVPKGSLTDALCEKRQDGKEYRVTSLTWGERFNIACDIARGLTRLHGVSHKIIHADLKSENVLLDKDNNPKICDFGLSRIRDSDGQSILCSGQGMGTEGYTAPELEEIPNEKPNEKTDMYSYGIILKDLVLAETKNNTNNNHIAGTIQKPTSEKTGLLSDSKVDKPNVKVDESKVESKLSRLMQSCTFYKKGKEATYSQRFRPSASEALEYLEERISEKEFDEKFPMDIDSSVSAQV